MNWYKLSKKQFCNMYQKTFKIKTSWLFSCENLPQESNQKCKRRFLHKDVHHIIIYNSNKRKQYPDAEGNVWWCVATGQKIITDIKIMSKKKLQWPGKVFILTACTYIITSKYYTAQVLIFSYLNMVMKCLGWQTQGASYGFICMGLLFWAKE